MTDKHKTRVRFVYLYGEILAVFLGKDAMRRFTGYGYVRQCYAHVGQHGACYDRAYRLKRVPPALYLPLVREMESLGYNLDIRQ